MNNPSDPILLPGDEDNPITKDAEVFEKPQSETSRRQHLSLSATVTRGPLPPPEIFAQYESVLPGSADRILKLAELQLEHRVDQEKKEHGAGTKETRRGQWFGFILALVALGGALYLLAQNQTIWSLIGLITVLGSLISIFYVDQRYSAEHWRGITADIIDKLTTRAKPPEKKEE